MEIKIGDIFTYNGKTYKVIMNNNSCNGCAFKGNYYCKKDKSITGECISFIRDDGKNIIFKEINNMEIKNNQLIINIPKGMEIDIKNSDLAKGIIKFKSKYITYDDIKKTLHLKEICIGITGVNNLEKLSAINKLMNIAKYYNKDWQPNWNNGCEQKYFIIWNNECKTYWTDYNRNSGLSVVYFKNKEDAQSVIDNPNFREILDTIYK